MASSVFGGDLSLLASTLECNTIDLAAETYLGLEPTIQDLGGNHCACGAETKSCLIVSTQLLPPEPLAPDEP